MRRQEASGYAKFFSNISFNISGRARPFSRAIACPIKNCRLASFPFFIIRDRSVMFRDDRKHDRFYFIGVADADVLALYDLLRIGTRREHFREHILCLAARDLLLVDEHRKDALSDRGQLSNP